MDQTTFLRSLELAFREHSADRLSRTQVRDSTGIGEPKLGALLEEAVDLGFVTGVDVAEERGPVQVISFTADGKRLAQSLFFDEQTYLGFQIAARPKGTMGSSSGEIFEVERDGTTVLTLDFSVTYSAAAEAGERPDQLAAELGQSYLRGLLLIDDYQSASRISHVVDSLNLPGSSQATTSDSDVESAVLGALGRMLLAEVRSNDTPYLDVDGLALVLGIEPIRISETLTQLEVMGYVESNAATFGRSMSSGACRITRSGLMRLESPGDRQSSRVPAAGNESPIDDSGWERRPRVFISYSHDGEEHDAAVRELATRLRAWGVEVEFDQYEPSPPVGWVRWMADMINWAEFVLVVCTEAYRRRAMGQEQTGKGLGATYEGTLISQEIFERGGENRKFIPVVLRREDLEHRPEWLRPYTHYNVSDESGFEDLYRYLTSQPAVERPAIGETVVLDD